MRRLLLVLALLWSLPSLAVVREGRVIVSSGSPARPAFGTNYLVTAYEVGAQVAAGSSGTTVTVRAGHGFAVGDKFIVGTDTTRYRTVSATTATTLTVSAVTVASGEFLVNLGPDTGTTSPNYNGSGVTIYTDMAYANAATNSTVTATSTGTYRYFHKGASRWELVRASSGTPIALYTATDADPDAVCRESGNVCAWLKATSGTGTVADPFVTAGSNPVQAAIDSCPTTGCTVLLADYNYTLGTADPAVLIPKTTSGTDKRFYRIIGNGAVLNYSGTGVAIEYWQDHTGTPGSSVQNNFGNELSGFSLRQTGTGRTGTGIWINYGTLWSLHDLQIGTLKADRAAGDNGFAYGIKFAERTGSYQTVDDFNTIDRCRFSGNTHAIYAGQQADNLRLIGNYFEANPNVSAAQDGVEIANSNAISIIGNTFNFFKFTNTTFAVKLSTDFSGAQISGNYFEGNSIGVYLYTDQNQDGVSISGNMFSLNSVTGSAGLEAYGIRAGIDGGTYKLRGLTISGNEFASIGEYEAGFRIGSEVRSCQITANHYTLVGGANDLNNLIQNGAECVISGEGPPAVSTVVDTPQVRVMHGAQDFVAFRAENTSSSAGNSPWFQWIAGGSGHEVVSAYASSTGDLYFRNTAGSTMASLTAAGALDTAGNVTSGGHLRGLNSAVAVSGNDAVATSGRFEISLTNTTGTNTITLVAPSSVDGKILVLRLVSLAGGTSLTLADSGTCALSAAWVPNADDTLTLIASGSVWYEIARSAN